MSVNKSPWLKNLNGQIKPLTFPGQVAAGSTRTIKRGAICTFNENSGVWTEVNAIADARYALAIANEEQKAADAARYIEFIALRPEDVFEFELNASAQVEIGDGLILTASNSQKLTRDIDGSGGVVVAHVVNIDNYPESGTTLGYRTYAQVVFNPAFSFWMQKALYSKLQKIITSTGALTLLPEDCGALVIANGAQAITLPESNVPPGWWVEIVLAAAAAVTIDPKPDTASLVVAGAVQTAGKYMSMTDEADFVKLVWDGTNWYATAGISGADGDISIQS